jgi:hypothetical protein
VKETAVSLLAPVKPGLKLINIRRQRTGFPISPGMTAGKRRSVTLSIGLIPRKKADLPFSRGDDAFKRHDVPSMSENDRELPE